MGQTNPISIPSKHPTSTVGYMFDSADVNIQNIVAPLLFKLAILYENIIIMIYFLELKNKIKLGCCYQFYMTF